MFSQPSYIVCLLILALAAVHVHSMTMHSKLANIIQHVKEQHVAKTSGPLPPQLPSSFNATVTATLPIIGKVTGPFYFDYVNSRMRTDFTILGQTQASVAFYNEMVQYDLLLPNGPCQVKKLTDPIYPFIIPPFASFVGFETVYSKYCQHWHVALSPYILDYYVTADLNGDNGKETYYMVRFSLSTDPSYPLPTNIQMDFANVQVGPQADSVFSIWTNGNCPAPKPQTHYQVSGYTKNAATGKIVPNIEISLSYGNQIIKQTSDKNGLFTFNKVLAGSDIVVTANPYYFSAFKQNISQLLGNINAGTVADVLLSETLSIGNWRVVLTWSSSPRDLDLHLMMPNGCQTSFSNRQCISQQGNSTFESDDVRNGFGSETILLTPAGYGALNSEFVFFVYNYGNEASFVYSKAIIKVYSSAGFVGQIQIPTSGYDKSARYWKVFKMIIDNEGYIRLPIINTVSDNY